VSNVGSRRAGASHPQLLHMDKVGEHLKESER
jgi:hypothetical protein